MRRWLAAAAATGAAAALALGGCSGRPAGVDGDLTDDWTALAAAKPFQPEPGTCNAGTVGSGSLASFEPIDCGSEYWVQVVHRGTFSGAAAGRTTPPAEKGSEVKSAYGECDRAAKAFVGGEWRSARLSLTVVFPTPQAWKGGARWFRCDVGETRSLDDTSLTLRTGSLEDVLAKPSPLALGCFNPTAGKNRIEEMVAVTCTKGHHAEFVGIYTAPDAAYTSFERNDIAIHQACLKVVATYAKLPKDGTLQYRTGTIYYYPPEDDWAQGNRGVQCFMWRSDRTLTRSVKGAGAKLLPVS
jgi:hypothetical protein